MRKFAGLLIAVSALCVVGCSTGEVSAGGAEASYEEQGKKAEKLAKEMGETPAPAPQGQGE